MKSILIDSEADLILYGMGERNTVEVVEALRSGLDIKDIIYVKGTVWKTKDKELIDKDAILKFKNIALNPSNIITRGTAQNEDIYFQATEVRNKFYDNLFAEEL